MIGKDTVSISSMVAVADKDFSAGSWCISNSHCFGDTRWERDYEIMREVGQVAAFEVDEVKPVRLVEECILIFNVG